VIGVKRVYLKKTLRMTEEGVELVLCNILILPKVQDHINIEKIYGIN